MRSKSSNGACHVIFVLYSLGYGLMVQAQSTSFHGAPTSAKDLTPPSIADSGESGQPLYARHCASCHGATGQGSGNIPSLTTATVKSGSLGELFWFISNGDPGDGMPSWEQLPEKQRWQIVSYLKAVAPFGAAAPAAVGDETSFEVAPALKPPFTDSRNRDSSTRSRQKTYLPVRHAFHFQWPTDCSATSGRLAQSTAWL